MAPRFSWIANLESSIPKRLCIQTSACPPIPCQLALTRIIQQRRYDTTLASPNPLKHTSLSKFHIAKGAKMVPFAGYLMPVQYNDLRVGDSHKWTRAKASLFDVGHMVQHHIAGPGAVRLLEKMTPSSMINLQIGQSTLSLFLHPETGGIVDDAVITRLSQDSYYIVTNAACREKDICYINQQIKEDRIENGKGGISWEVYSDRGLIALQGPLSASILQNALSPKREVDLKRLYFGQCASVTMNLSNETQSGSIFVSRGGYTGEDGFELSVLSSEAVEIVENLLKIAGPDQLRLAGLGARDSLRLEAGMCLYGHDLDDSITPVEAGLSWVVHKDRRVTSGFHGSEVILRQLRPAKEGGGPPRRRVGLIVEGAPAREGAVIVANVKDGVKEEERVVGKVTSGCPSPTLGKNIAMGYVESGHHNIGTDLRVVIRGKSRKAVVVKMPFVKSRYWKETVGQRQDSIM